MTDRTLSGLVAVLGAVLFIWSLRSGEANFKLNFFPRSTHPKTYWTLMACYAAMAIAGVAGFLGWLR